MPVVDLKIVEFGVVGLALIVTYRVLGIMGHLLLSKKGIAAGAACQMDSAYLRRIYEIHKHTEGVQRQIDSGEFHCAWKGRDEVRDMLESIRTLNTSIGILTKALENDRRN